ncbi:phage tail protein [Enterococcus sp. AZ126]|uniref:phage tail protein n=1 Tax=Enterococcus sp. AZ126 TaxID=2774635 RepID=UPI003F291031
MEKKIDVIAVLTAVDKEFNKSLSNVLNLIDKVKVSADMLTESIVQISSGVGSFRLIADSVTVLSTSLSQIISQYAALANAQKEIIPIQSKIDNTSESMKELSTNLERITERLKDASVFGKEFDSLSNGFKAFQDIADTSGLNDLKEMIMSVSTTYSGLISKNGQLGKTMSDVKEKYSLAKQVMAGKLEVDDSSFKKLDEGMQGFVEKIAGTKEKYVDFVSDAKDKMNVFGLAFMDKVPIVETFGNKVLDAAQNSETALGKIVKVGSGVGEKLGASFNVGTKALGGMVKGLTSIMGVAIKALAPAAIIGLALAGLGLANSQFGDELQGFITTAIEKGPEIITGFVNGIISKLPDLMTSGTQLIAGFAEAIAVNLPVIMQSAVNLINALVQGVIESLPTLIPAALMLIESLATSLLSAAPQLLMTGLNLLMALVSGIVDNKDQIINTVTNIIESFTTNITGQLPEIIKKGVEILMKLAEGIASILPVLIPVAIEAIATLVRTLSEQLPTIISAAVKIIATLVAGLLNELPSILVAAGKLIWELAKGILGALPSIATVGYQIINELSKALFDIDLFEIGGNIIQGFINGITEKAKKIWEVLENIGNGIKDFFTGNFKIHSPYRWMRDEIGAMLPAGLAIGIERNAHVVDKPMNDLASQIMLPSLDSLDQHLETVQDISVQSSSKQMMIPTKQPATFNIKLGNQQFKAFVSDISEAMGQDSAINLAF